MISKKFVIVILLLIPAGFWAGWFLARQNHLLVESPGPRLPSRYACPLSKEVVEAYYPKTAQGPAERVDTVIVNHHLLAANLIAENLAAVATDQPLTIILVSPNHFGRGSAKVIASAYRWETCFGYLHPDIGLINKLSGSGLVEVDELPFETEHGIYNIVPFIKRSFPNAGIVALMVKETADPESLEKIAEVLKNNQPKQTLVIGSFDFSHEVASTVADKQDESSINLIRSMDPHAARQATLDSKRGLELLMDYAKLMGDTRFKLTASTNAAKLTGKLDSTDVTSYVTGYFSGP